MTVAQGVVLSFVVALQLVCAVGVLLVDDPFDRLHLLGPVSVLGSILLIVTVLLGGPSTSHLAKVAATGALLWATSPFVTRASARALRIRATGRLAVTEEELEEEPT